MSLDRLAPEELERPVSTVDDLVGYFRAGEKPRERWRVGVEHEKLAVDARGAAVPYDGERGVEAFLRSLARQQGWKPLTENGHVVALEREGTSVSLEPGAQVELDGTPSVSLHEVIREIREHVAELRRVSDPLGIHWLGLGLHPFSSLGDVPRVPRQRYRIMREVLAHRGDLAHEMMHLSASLQASFDYSDEADLVEKFRTALAVSPAVGAMFANSSLRHGGPSGFVSWRLHAWERTDPDRTGLLPFVFEPDFGYRRYAEWACSVPMFFVVRDGRYRPVGGKPFGRFMAEGHGELRATLADFALHLTTLFPHARLKRILEVRVSDAVPPELLPSVPALWTGLLYDDDARRAALELGTRWDAAGREEAMAAAARTGLAASVDGLALGELARELEAIAREGLRRRAQATPGVEDERPLLDPLADLLEQGRSPGEQLLEHWQGAWGRDPARLIEHTRY